MLTDICCIQLEIWDLGNCRMIGLFRLLQPIRANLENDYGMYCWFWMKLNCCVYYWIVHIKFLTLLRENRLNQMQFLV